MTAGTCRIAQDLFAMCFFLDVVGAEVGYDSRSASPPHARTPEHTPQDQLGRAEGYHIVHADHQYIVPTDGKPIR